MRDYTLSEIADSIGGSIIGDASIKITGIASLSAAQTGQICFANGAKYLKLLSSSNASAFVLTANDARQTSKPVIVVDDPYQYFAKLSAFLNPPVLPEAGIAQSAIVHATTSVPESCAIGEQVVIGEGVSLGENVIIKSGTVIETGTSIGDNTVIEPNVTIKHHVDIGAYCHIFSGSVIGAEGFGYAESNAGEWSKIPQIGKVVIHDHVDIGANTTIDRGALDDTVIETGVKLDNQIQIAHNCHIGAHTVMAACVGIAGSAIIGKHCKIGGAAMILGHLTIADKVTISPGSMITRSISKAGTYTALMPFQPHKEWLSTAAQLRNIDGLSAKIKQLEKTVKALKKN